MIHSKTDEGGITRPKFVPQADYETALKGLAKFNRDEEERRSKLEEQVNALNKKMEASLVDLLGKARYEKWMSYKAALREESKKWAIEKEASEKYSIGARMKEFYKANEMPVDRMHELAKQRQLTYDKIVKESYGQMGKKKNEKDVDMGSLVPKSNACTPEQYRYPWHWDQHGYSASWNGYRITENHNINGQSGLISAELNAVIQTGDDYDKAYATNHSQHGTWVHSGQGGILTAYILVECLQDKHEIHAFDEEWQWSWMNSHTENDIMFHVLHPHVTGYGRARMSNFRLSLDDSGHYHHYDRSFLDYGSHHWAIINSRGPVPPNTWVFVRFGSSLTMDVQSNDYKVNATLKASWNIKTFFILCNA